MVKTKIAFWIIFALTLINFSLMTFWSMPAIQQFSTLQIFDLRTGGYSFLEAHALLEDLGPKGIELYISIQQYLDTSYPALLATSTGFAIFLLSPSQWGIWRYGLALLVLPGMVTDYLENSAIQLMLKTGPQQLHETLVEWASSITVLKFQLYGLAGLVLVGVLARWLIRKLRPKSTS